MINDITGIILAGGKSKRMGYNKALLKIGEKTIIEQIAAKLKAIFREIVVVGEDTGRYNALEVRLVKDIIPSQGPLGGIYTGLVSSSSFYNFIIACDMPFLNLNLIRYMMKMCEKFDVVIPEYKTILQPLCAIYSKDCIDSIKEQLSKNNFKVTGFLSNVRLRIISENEILRFDPQGLSFVNINTLEEYKKYNNFGCYARTNN